MEMTFDLTQFIQLAIAEDIGDGDHSALSCIPASAQKKAHLLVKEPGVLAGMEIARAVFHEVDPSLEMSDLLKDGQEVKPGDIGFTVQGNARSILQAERLVLNLMQRMSGIATRTAGVVKLLEGTSTRILDTRKTTPNLRYFEKLAVRIGGGVNHRFGLYDMIMLKDNHIDYAGGIREAMERVRDYLSETGRSLPVEVETRNMGEVRQALAEEGVTRIMLDNFTPAQVKIAVDEINGRVETEASGGITPETIRPYAEAGVDFVSMGALTHSVKSLDLSLKAIQ
ncbi:MAG: carboxylating nicotinate-nucleotide diphosphorylase [Flavobacteriales bacterium]|nr:carboxylating nicotinate-nucleotide diphosphorylase [Flavobacteriales bacterium]MDG1781395.1 carboxylating nicotinate-nucleotide diphosphorylase [Flavobacteriales bacterium]MDG2247328.1 carboxylating nicotinate-nucleotide diphosphorylase [Flavobacteriales bacterium]